MSAARAAVFAPDPRRRSMLGKVHIARKELGLDEETYRALLQRVVAVQSAAALSEAQLGRVLDEFKRLGWKPVLKGGKPESLKSSPAAPRTRAADHAVAGKARALWISLHQLGAVRDPSERALEGFAKRQLGVDRLQWADQSQGYRLIEALKAMAERAGWEQDVSQARIGDIADPIHVLKVRLVRAQWGRLSDLGAIKGGRPPVCSGLAEWGVRNGVSQRIEDPNGWTDPALERAAALLGAWINRGSSPAAAD